MNWAALNLYLDAMTAHELRWLIRELMYLAVTQGKVRDSIQIHGETRPATALVFLLQSLAKQSQRGVQH